MQSCMCVWGGGGEFGNIFKEYLEFLSGMQTYSVNIDGCNLTRKVKSVQSAVFFLQCGHFYLWTL